MYTVLTNRRITERFHASSIYRDYPGQVDGCQLVRYKYSVGNMKVRSTVMVKSCRASINPEWFTQICSVWGGELCNFPVFARLNSVHFGPHALLGIVSPVLDRTCQWRITLVIATASVHNWALGLLSQWNLYNLQLPINLFMITFF